MSQVNVANAAATFDISGTTAGASVTTLNGVAGSGLTLGSQALTISNGSTTYAGVIAGTGALTIGGGTQTLSGANSYTGVTTINAGTLALSGNGGIASSSQVNLANAAGTFDVSGTTAGATIATLNGVTGSNVALGAKTLTISNGSTTYAGVIGGTGGLALTSGNETLSGTNTYSGVTTVNGGTLALSGTGSVASSSQVNVANAAGTFDVSGATAGASIATLNGVANSNVKLGSQTLTISSGSTTYAGVRRVPRPQWLQPGHWFARRRRHGDKCGRRRGDTDHWSGQHVDRVQRRYPERSLGDRAHQGWHRHTHIVRGQHLLGHNHRQRRYAFGHRRYFELERRDGEHRRNAQRHRDCFRRHRQ
jgi:autotransporter-associated beta strand protein